MIKALGRFKDAAAIRPLVGGAQELDDDGAPSAIDALVAIIKDKKAPARDDVAGGIRAAFDRSGG